MRKNRKKSRYSTNNNSFVIKVIKNKWFMFIYLLSVTLISIVLHLYLQNKINETKYYIDHAKKMERRTKQNITELNTEITQLSRADRIQQIAKTKLNMINSKPQVDVIIIE